MVQDKKILIGKYFFFILLLLLTACGKHVNHKVIPGDTLYSIGWFYKQDYREIAKWNDISPPYLLTEGQWIRVAPPVDPWWADQYPDRYQKQQRHKIVKQQSHALLSPKKTLKQKPKLSVEPVEKWRWPTVDESLGQYTTNPQKPKGIMISGSKGQAVYAAAEGEVVYSGSGLIGYGKLIIIKHNKTYLSAYGHNDQILVGEGERVQIGQQIAKMGNTGSSEEVLLYFEIRKNGKPVDPVQFVAGGARNKNGG
ncbi:MAG: peptidoglycan DD-metalloendopeptidase family protein [Gammaproteobacteria bacterium]|nr:peptidoglycan DD-metalloendopeptidase family protein [Gammaproteobacteria bacterium]MDH5730251.1 peptidoglycan DD-metalloendopeptidase family protein [Gammaproteobacteria bacterium]